jgi:pantoate--beta-alanine ligase
LEDRFRPTHFSGVATVVAKLFMQTEPKIACFGEKDYQQLKVIERMVEDLDMPVRIVPVPTLREGDGLALSSRNRYLSPEERRIAPLLYQHLQQAAGSLRQGNDAQQVMNEAFGALNQTGFSVDYVEARDADTLIPLEANFKKARILAAAKLGTTRLIDNIAV